MAFGSGFDPKASQRPPRGRQRGRRFRLLLLLAVLLLAGGILLGRWLFGWRSGSSPAPRAEIQETHAVEPGFQLPPPKLERAAVPVMPRLEPAPRTVEPARQPSKPVRMPTRIAFNVQGDAHGLILGATCSGKGRGHVIPTMLSHPGSVLAFDPKGELAAITGRRRAEPGAVSVIDPTEQGPAAFNPLLELSAGAALHGNCRMAAKLKEREFKGTFDDPGYLMIEGEPIKEVLPLQGESASELDRDLELLR